MLRMKVFGKSGKPLVLLPGMMCDERLWQDQIEKLSNDYIIYVPDISKHKSIDQLGKDIMQELPQDPLYVAGLSMGGIIAMELLRTNMDRIAMVALLDTNHKSELEVRQKMRDAEINQVEAGGLRDIMVSKMKPAYLIPGRNYAPGLSDMVLNMAMEQGEEAFVNQSVALRDRRDYTEVLKAVECSVLIAYGEKDLMCPPSRHKQMYELLPNKDRAVLQEIKDSGHLTPLEQPQTTTNILKEWLQH